MYTIFSRRTTFLSKVRLKLKRNQTNKSGNEQKTRTSTIVDFKLTPEEAKRVYKRWLTKGSFLKPLWSPSPSSVRAVFLPFYVFDIRNLETRVHSAFLGFGKKWKIYNSTNRYSYSYSPANPIMQIYGSNKYPKEYVQVAKGWHVQVSKSLRKGGAREIEPFTIRQDYAAQLLRKNVIEAETKRITKILKKRTGAKVVSDLKLEVDLAINVSLAYLPIYIIEFKRMGHDFACYVSGYNGEITGEFHYSLPTVSILSFFTVTAILQPFGPETLDYYELAIWASIWFGLIYTAIWGRFSPISEMMKKERSRLEELGKTPEPVQTLHRDILGYYKILGLDPNQKHSIDDIKSAYRNQALNLHPDMYQTADKKIWATEQFKKLTQAYKVIRNPRKKMEYDLINCV